MKPKYACIAPLSRHRNNKRRTGIWRSFAWLGAIHLCASMTPASAAYANWDWSSGNWTDAARWSSDPNYPNNGGTTWVVEVSAGTITRNISPTIQTLDFSGGTIQGTGVLTVQGAVSWSGGKFLEGNVTMNGGASITGNAILSDSSATLTLASGDTVAITGSGKLTLDDGAKVINQGTFLASNDQKIGETGSFQGSFTNNGTFTRNTSSGTFTIESEIFTNNGTLNVTTGTLALLHGVSNLGDITISSGATLKIQGANEVATGSSITGAGTLWLETDETYVRPTMSLSNPVVLAEPAKISIHDAHTLTFNSAFTWSGMLAREAEFAGGLHGFFVVNGGASITHEADLLDVTVTNTATSIASLASNASLRFRDGAILSNAGTLSLPAGSTLVNFSGTGNELVNTGSLVASAANENPITIEVPLTNQGTTTVTSNLLEINGRGSSTGTFQSASGAKMIWNDGYEFLAGTSFTGAGEFDLSNGHHQLAGSITTASDFVITSHLEISPGHAFTHSGKLFFSGHLIGGGSLVSNDSLELSGGLLTGSILKNSAGSIAIHSGTILGYYLTLQNGSTLRNEGEMRLQDQGGITGGAGSDNRFENSGTLIRRLSEDPYTISSEFINTGTIEVETGKLIITGDGSSSGGTWSIDEDAIIEISDDYQFTGTNAVSGNGTWIFGNEGGTAALAHHVIAGNFSLGSHVTIDSALLDIDPAAVVSTTGACQIISGSITGGGVFQAQGGTTISEITVNNATLSLGAGTSNVHAATSPITITNGGSLTNAGTYYGRGDFDYQSGAAAIVSGVGATSFVNSGTFIRDTGIGYYPVNVPFHNSGTVSTQSGLLLFTKGGSSNNGTWDNVGGSLILADNFTFEGTTTITGNYASVLTPGIYTVNGPITSAAPMHLEGAVDLAVQAGQTVTLNGYLQFSEDLTSAPKISGGGIVTANAPMYLRSAIIDASTLHLTVGQTANHTAAQALTLTNGAVFHNEGIYWAGVGGSIVQGLGVGNLFQNSGTLKQDGSTEIFTISAPLANSGLIDAVTGTLSFTHDFNSTGTVNIALTGRAEFSGTSSFDHATPFTGVGPLRFAAGTHHIVQSATSTVDLTIDAAAFTVAPAMTFDSTGLIHWNGGSIGGTGIVQASGGLDLTGAATLIDSTLSIPATATSTQSGNGAIILEGAAVINNAGTWQATNGLGISLAASSTGVINNSGTFFYNQEAGTFTVSAPLHNSGVVGVVNGTLSLSGDGTSTGEYNVVADQDLSISGSNIFSGDSRFVGPGRINLQAGTQNIADSMPSSAIINLSGAALSIATTQTFENNGAFHWINGPITGGGTLETSGTLDITTGARTLDGAVLSSSAAGVMTIGSLGSLILANGASLENNGYTFFLNEGTIQSLDASAVAIHNEGTITRDLSLGMFTIAVPFYHNGVLNLNSGSIALSGGGTANQSFIHTQAGTGLYIGANYTFGSDNFITGQGSTFFSNGSLHVTGSLTTDGSFHWSGGTLDGGGIFTVKGGLTIEPNSSGVFIDGSTLENALGSEAVISGSVATHILNGGTYRNSGLTRLQGNNNFNDAGGTGNSIVNAGTLIRDEGAGNYTVNLPIHNSGLIRSTSGALLFQQGGSMTAGSLDAQGGDIYLNGNTYVLNGGALTGTNHIYLTAGSANIIGNTGAASGTATGGFGIAGSNAYVTGSAMLSVDHGYFANGNMDGTATIRITGASTKLGDTHLNMNGGIIRNEGTWTNLTNANIDLDNSNAEGAGVIENHGLWTLTGSAIYHNSYGSGAVHNYGTFVSEAGASSILAAVHHHDGSLFRSSGGYVLLRGGGSMATGSTLDANNGDIYFYGGTHTLNGGTITGANHVYASLGTTDITGNIGASTGSATGGFGIAGSNAYVTGTAMLSVDRGYFGNGIMDGAATIRITGTSTKDSDTHLNMNGGIIRNEGTWTNLTNANIDLDSNNAGGAGVIENHGLWTLTGSAIYHNSYGFGAVHNYGTFVSAAGSSSILAAVHHHDGSLFRSSGGYVLLRGGGSMATGSTLDANNGDIHFYGGTHTLNGGTITGVNHVYASIGTVDIAGNIGASTGSATGGFGIAGSNAYVTGTAMLSADHGYFGNGYMDGAATIRITGTSTKDSDTHLNMNGGIIRNEGTWNNLTNANIDLDNSNAEGAGVIENHGLWTLTGSAIYFNSYGFGAVHNYGTFVSAAGASSILAAVHHHDGSLFRSSGGYVLLRGGGSMATSSTLDANNGDIYFYGGTHTLNGGTITGANHVYASIGTIDIAGNIGAPTGSATGGFGIAGSNAYVTGTAMLSADHGYFGNGIMDGNVIIRLTGASTKESDSHLSMYGGTIRNEGTWTNLINGNWDLDSSSASGGGSLDNRAQWIISNNMQVFNSYGEGSMTNTGVITVMTGNSTYHVPLTNSGAIHIDAGTLTLNRSSTHSGPIIAHGGIGFGIGTHTLSGNTAYLGGNGYSSGALTFTDGASLRPGASAGNFTNYGTLTFSAGGTNPSMVMEITSSTAFDTLTMANGSLLALEENLTDLVIQPSYAPALGTVFRIVTADSSNGMFSGHFRNAPNTGSVITTSFANAPVYFQVTYDSAGKSIDLTTLSPYQAWAAEKGLVAADAAFDADPDGDGISNGIEFVIQSEPNPNHASANSRALLPETHLTADYLRVIWRRSNASQFLQPTIEFDADLADSWSYAIHGTAGVIINVTPDAYGAGLDQVETLIPRSHTVDGKLFTRLQVTEP